MKQSDILSEKQNGSCTKIYWSVLIYFCLILESKLKYTPQFYHFNVQCSLFCAYGWFIYVGSHEDCRDVEFTEVVDCVILTIIL